jgi:DNA-binding NarL/FixJ family response regulator
MAADRMSVPLTKENDNSITVLIADDFEPMRGSLQRFLHAFDELHLVGFATNGAEAVSMCVALAPRIVLMDIEMPIMDGIEATRIIRRNCPGTRVIGLTGFEEERVIHEMLRAGAWKCLTKTTPISELAQAIRDAASE